VGRADKGRARGDEKSEEEENTGHGAVVDVPVVALLLFLDTQIATSTCASSRALSKIQVETYGALA